MPVPTTMNAYVNSLRQPARVYVPRPRAGQVLVRVEYFGVTQEDVQRRAHTVVAQLGTDFSGRIADTHVSVEGYAPGDRVFGFVLHGGAFAEYVVCDVDTLAHVPTNVSLAEAATLPDMWLAALQLLRNDASFEQRNRIVVMDAFSARGQACIQLAQLLGCRRVHAIVHTEEAMRGVLEQLRLHTALVDEVVPSSFKDMRAHYTASLARFDPKGVECVVDLRSQAHLETGMLRPGGRYVLTSAGGPHVENEDWLRVVSKRLRVQGSFLRSLRQKDIKLHLDFLVEHVLPKFDNGELAFRIDRTFTWTDVARAVDYVSQNPELAGCVLCSVPIAA